MARKSLYALREDDGGAPPVRKQRVDRFVTGPMSAEAVNAASMAFTKALIERVLGAGPMSAERVIVVEGGSIEQ